MVFRFFRFGFPVVLAVRPARFFVFLFPPRPRRVLEPVLERPVVLDLDLPRPEEREPFLPRPLPRPRVEVDRRLLVAAVRALCGPSMDEKYNSR